MVVVCGGLAALRGVNGIIEGRSQGRSGRGGWPRAARLSNCSGSLPETGTNPDKFASRTTAAARARAHSLPSMMLFAPRSAPSTARTDYDRAQARRRTSVGVAPVARRTRRAKWKLVWKPQRSAIVPTGRPVLASSSTPASTRRPHT